MVRWAKRQKTKSPPKKHTAYNKTKQRIQYGKESRKVKMAQTVKLNTTANPRESVNTVEHYMIAADIKHMGVAVQGVGEVITS